MSSVARFEDLIAWQKARTLCREAYEASRNGRFAKDFALVSQFQRAAVSIMSNIAEGYERASRPEFRRFLLISKGSCAEFRSLLYVAHDEQYLTDSQFEVLLDQAEEVARVIGGLTAAAAKPRLSPSASSLITHHSSLTKRGTS